MARAAQPHDVDWLVIVLVVSMGWLCSAPFTWLRLRVRSPGEELRSELLPVLGVGCVLLSEPGLDALGVPFIEAERVGWSPSRNSEVGASLGAEAAGALG